MSQETGLLTAEQILDVGRKLLELRPTDDVLNAVVNSAAQAMNAETSLVILRDREPGKLSIAASCYADATRTPELSDISNSLLEAVFADRKPVLTESAVQDPRFSSKSSIILQHIQTAVIVPLIGHDDIEGAIYLDSRSDRTSFREENLGPLSTLAAFCTLALENARRYDSARREIEHLKKTSEPRKGRLIGSSPEMQELYSLIDRMATSDLPVFIFGESGTGKELVAREIHDASSRGDKPFVALYCGNVSSEIFESELFGHKIGSFTGAIADKPGLVEAAAGGTLFLDEVADIPLPLQAKLLRFLQDSQYRRVGDTVIQRADVRIVAATNKDLQQEVGEGRFREDLFYRLYILPIRVPPLRERASDIPSLVRHFLAAGRHGNGGPKGIVPDALQHWLSYHWPGNVRELENAVARAQVIAQGERIELSDILDQKFPEVSERNRDLSWSAAERRHVLEVLSLCDGNKSRAAKVLGISRRYLYYKLDEWAKLEPGKGTSPLRSQHSR